MRTFRTARLKRLSVAMFVVYLICVCFLGLREFVYNYSQARGLVLANGRHAGSDFLSFYAAGKIFRDKREHLYDFSAQQDVQHQIFGEQAEAINGALPFIYPPANAAVYSLFSRLEYLPAYALWLILSLAISILCAIATRRRDLTPILAIPFACLCLLGFEPFLFECLAGGQTSAFGLLAFFLVSAAIQSERDFLAGLALSLGCYKPPLFFGLGLLFLLKKRIRLLLGALLGSLLFLALNISFVGVEGLVNYLHQASSYTYGQQLGSLGKLPPDRGVGLYGLMVALSGGEMSDIVRNLYFVISAGFILGVTWLTSKRFYNRQIELALFIATSLYISPQMINYDLTCLLIPFSLLLNSPQKSTLGLLAAIGFYFEWLFRKLTILGVTLNTAGLLGLVFIAGLATSYQAKINCEKNT